MTGLKLTQIDYDSIPHKGVVNVFGQIASLSTVCNDNWSTGALCRKNLTAVYTDHIGLFIRSPYMATRSNL